MVLNDEIAEIKIQNTLEPFFDLFLHGHYNFLSLWIISPWITPLDSASFTLDKVIDKINQNKVSTYIVTRMPRDDPYERGLQALASSPWTDIMVMENLHAKLYICDNLDYSFAMIGSANLTAHAAMNSIEVGLLVKDAGWGTTLIRNLVTAAKNIRAIRPHYRIKEVGKRLDARKYDLLKRELISQ